MIAGAPPVQAAATTQPVLITLLHTNDVHGYVYLPGKAQGSSKIATLVRGIRAEMPHVLLLDAGDMIHGTPVEKAFKGEAAIAAMNAMGYDAAASGNHEYDWGQDATRKAFKQAAFPILSANVLDTETGKPFATLKPYIIRDIDGVRVAIFGLTTPTTVQIEWPRTIQGITFADYIPIAKELVARLRTKEHADVVIALTHLGVPHDKELADAVPGIDIILGGHSHTRLDQQVWENGVLIMQTGAHAVALGRADFLVDPPAADGRRHITINGKENHWWGHDGVAVPAGFAAPFPDGPLISLTEAIADDPAVLAAYRPYQEKVAKQLDEVLTEALDPMPAVYATRREVAVGQLLADAIRAHSKTDIALAASSQFNPLGLLKGPVRVADLYELLPNYTRQHIVTLRTPGANIRQMAAHLLASGQMPVQISGFRVAGAQISVGDQPLDDSRLYTVAGPAHVIQEYYLNHPGVIILDDNVAAAQVRDALIEFLRGHSPLRNTAENRFSR
ncbi:MAG TPA: bifunctional UDP-sugar hydrolase/5'-nucleotidase [Tepidisphaeraceae bacterium]|nr:bifunctional UDP-sugar hydrolase/5'-nucleotidase [Tepidisphaeraceae bacterium]